MHREDNNYNDEGLILSLHTAYRLIWPCVLHTKLKQHWCFNFSISIQFPCDAHVVNLYLVEFYLSAFCVVVAVMVEHFVELVFCFMVCVVEVCLVFFLHLTLVSFVPWFVLSKFVLLFWFDFENEVFCFAVLVHGLRFLIIVENWSPGAVLLIGLWFLFAWKILLNFNCALCWVLLIKEVYFLIEMTAHL